MLWLKGLGVVFLILLIWMFKADHQTRIWVTFALIGLMVFFATQRNKK